MDLSIWINLTNWSQYLRSTVLYSGKLIILLIITSNCTSTVGAGNVITLARLNMKIISDWKLNPKRLKGGLTVITANRTLIPAHSLLKNVKNWCTGLNLFCCKLYVLLTVSVCILLFSKQVWSSTILSSTIILIFFDNWRMVRF